MPRRANNREIPRPAIADVLREITGAEHIPTGYGWQRMHCPWHEDRTPSAAVNHEIDGFTCHSCGRSGDPLKLLQTELGLSFREACDRARMLADSESTGRKTKKRTRRPSDLLKRGL